MTRTLVYALTANATTLALLAIGIWAATHDQWAPAGICWVFVPSLWFVAGRLTAMYRRERAVVQQLGELRREGLPLNSYERAVWTEAIARIDLPDDRSAA